MPAAKTTSLLLGSYPVSYSLVDPDTPAGQQPVGITGKTLVMSEEFNGSLIDTDVPNGYVKCRPSGPEWAVWYPNWPRFTSQTPGGNHTNTSVDGYYQRNRVSTAAGSLVLDAVKDAPVSGLNYSLGMLQSLPGFTISAGRFVEARIQMSAMTPQSWPAGWMASAIFDQWPPEIDYFEAPVGGNGTSSTLYQNVYNSGDAAYTTQFAGVDMTAWHTYACDWQAGTVKFYMDGALKSTATRTLAGPQYLLFDMAAASGGTFSSESMFVDYVRVWQ